MEKEELMNKMKLHSVKFDDLWSEIVRDINEFKKTHPDYVDVQYSPIDKLCDSMCLSGSWMIDRMNGYSGLTHNSDYRKTLAKKIRKALGYTV